MSRSIEVILTSGEPMVVDVGEMLTVDFDWIAGQLAAEDVELFCLRLEIETRNLPSSVASSVSSMNKSRQLKFSGIDPDTAKLIRFRLVPGDFPILLRDRGLQWEVKMQPEDSVIELKRRVAEYREKTAGHSSYQIDQRTLERIHLTHRGKELLSNDRISQLSINYYRPDTATPLREMSVDADLIVTVRDENFHSNEETISLQNSWNLERLKKAYEEKTKRNLVWESEREGGRRHYDQGTKQECKFYLIQRGMANDEEKGDDERKILLNKSQSLYEQGIDDDSTIILEPAPFRLHIVEKKKTGVLEESKDNPITLTGVYDYWSVKRLKDEYNQRLTDISTGILPENLDSNDILLYNGRELTPDSSDLCSFNMIDNAQLIIKREDLTQIACLYVCSDCGVDVRLKRSDAVRCRECGNRIVFKKRENKPLQHICR